MGNFRYDIVKQSSGSSAENLPLYFLGDTLQEAEDTYSRFSGLLNSLAYSYAQTTGIYKGDLFGEALVGLAVAKRDWDPDRSSSFRTYAIFRIKDRLHEYIRKNLNDVTVPSYVLKSYRHIQELRSMCEWAEAHAHDCIIDKEIPEELEYDDALRFDELINFLENAAARAKVSYETYIDRVSSLPEEVDHEDQEAAKMSARQIEMLEAALVVEKLKEIMDEEERIICDGIMKDMTYAEIGNLLGKSRPWVSKKLEGLKDKILSKMDSGEL
jgi:RNA polymerase sigma factor (sigma-70 family)